MSFLAMKTFVFSCVLSFFFAPVALAGAPIGNRWDKTKPISYTFSADTNEATKDLIREAMNRIQNSSCISFEEDGDSDQKLVINNERSCESSEMGKESSNKPNEIAVIGCKSSRSDRDDYLTFSPSVPEWAIERKAPADTDNLGVPFNYGSAMMGSAWAYSEGREEPTMQPKDMQYTATMRQLHEIAFSDFLALKRYYKCEESCESNPPLCENEGFPNPRGCSKCICPPFFSGDLCKQSTLVKVDSEATFNYTVEPSYTGRCMADATWINHNPHTPTIFEGPPGSHLLVTITDILQICKKECLSSSIEIVDGSDLRVAGKSFCCPSDASTTVLSSTNRVAIRASAPDCIRSYVFATISVVHSP